MQLLSDGQISLRSPEPEDLESMYAIENNPELWSVSSTTVPYSRYLLRQYIETSSADIFVDKQVRMVIQREADKRLLGLVDLTDLDVRNNRAEIGVVVLNEFRGQGIGTQALLLICRYAFDFLHIHQLYAYVAADSLACIRMFAKCGFECQVVLKEWVKCSEKDYKDVVLLQRLNQSV